MCVYMIITAPLLSLYIVFLVTLCSIYKLHIYTLSLYAKIQLVYKACVCCHVLTL